jgi:predicted acetyltransferase
MGAIRRTFGGPAPTPEDVERGRQFTEIDRTLGTFDGNELVATAGIITYEMTVPGGMLPSAGITRVTVLPTYRRRGLLTAMMRRQLDDIHEREEPLAALYASEARIYGRFGYGLGTYMAELRIDRPRAAFQRDVPPGGTLRFVDAETAVDAFVGVWDRARLHQPGMLSKSPASWRAELADPEFIREGASALYRVVYWNGSSPEGFALYRVRVAWKDNQPNGTLMLLNLIATTTEAYVALWRYCLDVDLMVHLTAEMRPVEEPLRFLLADAREPMLSVRDGVWLRLVDVAAALAGRRYAADDRLVLRVHDAFCPWNDGRFELKGGPTGAECRRSDANPELELTAADLAALYLSGNRFRTLHAAGRVSELRPGAVARADAMFATDRAPWCPSHF